MGRFNFWYFVSVQVQAVVEQKINDLHQQNTDHSCFPFLYNLTCLLPYEILHPSDISLTDTHSSWRFWNLQPSCNNLLPSTEFGHQWKGVTSPLKVWTCSDKWGPGNRRKRRNNEHKHWDQDTTEVVYIIDQVQDEPRSDRSLDTTTWTDVQNSCDSTGLWKSIFRPRFRGVHELHGQNCNTEQVPVSCKILECPSSITDEKEFIILCLPFLWDVWQWSETCCNCSITIHVMPQEYQCYVDNEWSRATEQRVIFLICSS